MLGAVVLVAAAVTTYVLVDNHRTAKIMAADVLTAQGAMQGMWWESPTDETSEVRTEQPDGTIDREVPTIKGGEQGVLIVVTNRSEYPVTVVGSGSDLMTVAISDVALRSPADPRGARFAESGTLQPREVRYLRVRPTAGLTCEGYVEGGGIVVSSVAVRLEVEGVARTVDVEPVDRMMITSQEDSNPPACPAINGR